MLDIRAIREDAHTVKANLSKRGAQWAVVIDEIASLDGQLRQIVSKLQDSEAERNAKSKAIGAAKKNGNDDEAQALMAAVGDIKAQIEASKAQEQHIRDTLNDMLAGIPNIPMPEIPLGDGEEDNQLVSTWGKPTSLDFTPKDHVDVGAGLGGMDFETAAKMSGSRFVLLSGGVARLERALAAFMLDVQTLEHGYTETSPPYLVRDDALFGTGQLPKFEDDMFKTNTGHYTISTSEIPLTNIVRDSIIEADALPKRFTAHTPCFRSEAGSAGRDTRGMIRLHQFNKVEMVSIVRDSSDGLAELERMTRCAETILERLELPYRRMLLCTGDMGFGARKTYDLEVWLPAQDAYREISSCSYCGDFQARRMDARWRPKATEDIPKPKPEFVHTLNGSGLAVGRTLVAVLENYQNADGSVSIPDALIPYMGNVTKLRPV